MKHVFCMAVLLLLLQVSHAQKSYIVEVNRVTNQVQYFQKTFDKGRPVEKKIEEPTLRYGDIVTVRMTQFNELLYGLEVEGELVDKPREGIVSKVLEAGARLGATGGFSPALGLFSDLIADPEQNIVVTRGGTSNAAASLKKRLLDVAASVNDINNQYAKITLDEGLDRQEMLDALNRIGSTASLTELQTELKSIKEETDALAATDQDAKALKEELDENKPEETLEQLMIKIKNEKKILHAVDFVQERTIVVDEENYEGRHFNIKIRVYKRAFPIAGEDEDDLKSTIKPYDFDSYSSGKTLGDYLHQKRTLKFNLAYKHRLYFSVSAARVFVPNNRFSYDQEYDDFGDSVRFASRQVGGGKTAFGMHLNYDLPIKSSTFTTSATIGYMLSFANNPFSSSESGGSQNETTGFFTLGASFKLIKMPYLSLNTGVALAKYQQLSDKYKADVFYESYNITQAELDAQITKKIKPAFSLGVSVNL